VAKAKDSDTTKDKIDGVKDVLIGYAKQELKDPLMSLGKWAGLGVAGAVLWAIGLSLVALAFLRLLQTETGTLFDANFSWAPYAIVLFVLAVIIGVTFKRKLK
jgi:hypothetical protein